MQDWSGHNTRPLWDDGEFIVSRWTLPNGGPPVLAVMPLPTRSPTAAIGRLERAYAIRGDLDPAWAARPLELVREQGKVILLTEDPAGELLASQLGEPWDLSKFLRIAVGMTSALGQLHRRGFIHRAIKPGNFIVAREAGRAWLTGFGFAARPARQRRNPETLNLIAGTLAYVAPEQTGRMNRSVDFRSDLYSLGITFYEMLAGLRAFVASDPMEWIHHHVARFPTSPSDLRTDVPLQVSAIILKLLSKNPEERYQTAAGLERDLRRCSEQWDAVRRIDSFPLASHDIPDRFMIPETLFGRERELETLRSAFERVLSTGRSELVLVSGRSGIGKSALVNELHKVLIPPRGLFASGKFDQQRRDRPYDIVSKALRGLVLRLLTQSDLELATWSGAIREALGINAELIVNIIPELELVIGKQLPVPEVPPEEARNRFQTALRRFVAVFGQEDHPLVLFLDDLQWLDKPTLDLIGDLVTQPGVGHLLLIGAFRDNEVSASHPLMQKLEVIGEMGAAVHQIALQPLGVDELARLLSAALYCSCASAGPLAQLIHEKTLGNPFFAIQFISTLADEGLIFFDYEARVWAWDFQKIKARGYTDSVAEFMIDKLNCLPADTKELLKFLACVGNPVSTMMLQSGNGSPLEKIQEALWTAVEAGLLLQTSGGYAFPHDRIQEAAYALIPQSERARTHLQIGTALVEHIPAGQLEQEVFEIANQLNLGVPVATSHQQREWIAEFNLVAARRSKATTAYASALGYLNHAVALLAEGIWERRYSLVYEIMLYSAECELLLGNLQTAESLIGELLSHATFADRVAVYLLKVDLHVKKSENASAVDTALECLRLYGISLDAHPSRESFARAYAEVWHKLGNGAIESLIELPRVADPNIESAMRVLSALYAPSVFTDEKLSYIRACYLVMLTLDHGVAGASADGLAWFGILLAHLYERYSEGYRFSRVAQELVETHGFLAYRAKSFLMLEIAGLWVRPVSEAINSIRAAFSIAVETGDVTVACYACNHLVTDLLLRGDSLEIVLNEVERGLEFVERANFADVVKILIAQQRFIENMRGRTSSFSTFDGGPFSELEFERSLMPERLPIMVFWYWVIKAQARIMSGDFDLAAEALERAKPLRWASPGHIQLLDYHFISALTIASLNSQAQSSELDEHLQRLLTWKESCPETFADKYFLAAAEKARMERRDFEAARLYEDAIRSAGDAGFMQAQGLAFELAAKFYLDRDFDRFGREYLRNARQCYSTWGAAGKVRQLDANYPFLSDTSRPFLAEVTANESVETVDLNAVVKISQAVSSEIVLEKLIDTLMVIALEHAGADRGLLIQLRGAHLQIEAEATTVRDTVQVQLRHDLVSSANIPVSVLHYVMRTRESVLVDDVARLPAQFSGEKYFTSRGVRSLFCLPLVRKMEIVGILYLESRVASNVFTTARSDILRLLVAQAAISLESAHVYKQLLESEERLRVTLDTIPSMAWVCAPDGAFEIINQRWLAYTGFTESAAMGWNWMSVIHPEDVSGLETYWRNLLSTGESGQYEARMRHHRGDYRWFLFRVEPLRDKSGNAVNWYGTSTDIEDRKQTEEALRASERNLRHIVDAIPGLVWRATPEGDFDYVNERFRAYVGPNLDALADGFWQRSIHPDDLDMVVRKWNYSIATGEAFEAEYRRRESDGTYRWFRNLAEAAHDSDGAIAHWYGLLIDIDDHKKAAQHLERTQMRLAQAAQLATAGELAASIAHEVSQPLAAVLANAEASMQWLSGESPNISNARRDVARIVRDAADAGEVVGRVRALFRRSSPTKVALQINEVIAEVLRLLHNEILRRHIVVEASLGGKLPTAWGDRVQVQQVILNLLLNGIEAMESISDRQRRLLVRSGRETATSILVEIRDHGTGITDPEKIFDSFFTTKINGIGMGLSICRSIIEAHQGRLWVASCAGPGAKFCFTLPASTI